MSKTNKIRRLRKRVEALSKFPSYTCPKFVPNVPMQMMDMSSEEGWFYSVLDYISACREDYYMALGTYEGIPEFELFISKDIIDKLLYISNRLTFHNTYMHYDRSTGEVTLLGLPINPVLGKTGYLQLTRVK